MNASSDSRAPEKRGDDWAPRFLSTLAETGNVSESVRAAGIARSTAYTRRDRDPEFESEWDDAHETGVDALEREARRRAVDGTEKPVFYKGEQVGTIREYSDTLLIFLLKAGRPEKYRDNFDLAKFIAQVQAEREAQAKGSRVPTTGR